MKPSLKKSAITAVFVLVLAQALPSFADSPQFQYNIISISKTAPGEYPVVTFEVTNPSNGNLRYDLKTDPAFTQTANGTSRLFIQIGWNTKDYTNAGSTIPTTLTGGKTGPSLPIGINALSSSVSIDSYLICTATSTKPIPPDASGSGVAAIEGHPAGLDALGKWTVRVPVKSVVKFFIIAGNALNARRTVVETSRCNVCHQPLSAHGNNRVDNVQVCVICHNSNVTDVGYRWAGDGPEMPTDFKRMVHGIHSTAAGFRHTPLVMIGFNHLVADFTSIPFPGGRDRLRTCTTCHVDNSYYPVGPGTPQPNVRGTTINTRSIITATSSSTFNLIDNDPANDVKITPTASACSGCHDGADARQHMIGTGGASFSTDQASIAKGQVRERCIQCHGPGREKDVEVVHR